LAVIFISAFAYYLRPLFTDAKTKRYFLPALWLKMLGAIAVGVVYQFYYNGGDTYMYHTGGSRLFWQAIWESPLQGFNLFFKEANDFSDVYKYASQIYYFRDPQSLLIIKIAAFFDLFTFSTYSATALLFAVFSFAGMWALFLVFYRQYPDLHKPLASAVLLIPSVCFWGSGILKDSIVLGCLGLATYQFYLIFFEKRSRVSSTVIVLITLYLIFGLKKYVLLAYLPAVIFWVSLRYLKYIRSLVVRLMILPILLTMVIYLAYLSVEKISEGDKKYSIDKLAETAKITAYDIRYWTGKKAGSGYTLGELDGSFASLLTLAPEAINVSLFRPYLWEVKNSLMLFSALEGFFFLCLTLFALGKRRLGFFKSLSDPNIAFCFIFSLSFAFAVGVSTFNFGTLARYKIPLLPFFAVGLVLILYSKKERKLS
jgi:hypothetical protein